MIVVMCCHTYVPFHKYLVVTEIRCTNRPQHVVDLMHILYHQGYFPVFKPAIGMFYYRPINLFTPELHHLEMKKLKPLQEI
jgi:hypothetical protein